MSKKASPEQVAKHNDATRHIIMGMLTQEFPDVYATPACRAGDKIMKVLADRGYVPQIRACNQLMDGTNI